MRFLNLASRLARLANRGQNLCGTESSRELIRAAKSYLPEDWRYPTTEADVPDDVRQICDSLMPVGIHSQWTSYTCGAASLGTLLSHYGKNISDKKLEELTKTTEDGTEPMNLVRAAENLGLKVTQNNEAKLAHVLSALTEGWPVIVDYQVSYTPNESIRSDKGHYSVIIAADDSDLLMADPSRGVNPLNLRIVPQKYFEEIWWDIYIDPQVLFDRWMMVIEGPCLCLKK